MSVHLNNCTCLGCSLARRECEIRDRAWAEARGVPAPVTHEHAPDAARDKSGASAQLNGAASEAPIIDEAASLRPGSLLIYVAGPYRSASRWQLEQNIRAAEEYGYQIAKLGAYPVIPHANTRGYFEDAQPDAQFWLEGTLQLMRGCSALFMLPQWPMSSGARGEHLEALRLGKPIFEDLSQLGAFIRARQAASVATPPVSTVDVGGARG